LSGAATRTLHPISEIGYLVNTHGPRFEFGIKGNRILLKPTLRFGQSFAIEHHDSGIGVFAVD
jgi:hypothetical protein